LDIVIKYVNKNIQSQSYHTSLLASGKRKKKSITKPQICVYSKFSSLNSQWKIWNSKTQNWPWNNYFNKFLSYHSLFCSNLSTFSTQKYHFQTRKDSLNLFWIYWITRAENPMFTAFFPTLQGFVGFAACQYAFFYLK